MEGRYQQDISQTLIKAMGLPGQVRLFSARATMAVEDHWLFCTSLVSKRYSGMSLGQMGSKFGYDSGTEILDPGAFARELGAAFATHTSWGDVRLSAQHETRRLIASSRKVKRVVSVYHGPVCYPADAASVVNSFPEDHWPAIAPFQKHPEYEWQGEYRFAVMFFGEPRVKTLLLPITAELCALARLVWEDLGRREMFAGQTSWQGQPQRRECRL